MVRFGICDDDKEYMEVAVKKLREGFCMYCMADEDCECITYETGQKLVENMDKDNIDIFFLDIECGEDSGFDIAKEIKKHRKNPGIVYMTNYSNYITQAFVCRPLGFISKQSIDSDIEQPMQNIREYLDELRCVITFYANKTEKHVRAAELVSVEVRNHEVVVNLLENGEFRFRGQLSAYEKKLLDFGFVKIDRGILINKKYITKIEKNKVYLGNELCYEVSRRRMGLVRNIITGGIYD
ncbi:MAG: LytTR family DNA-binding domain-containing protein [Eubacteriales bacterium]|nr:LytTR family DNA-binding domain-containing protein [Eubacteriales bacterium]